jgi:hypothetical protein
MRHSYSVDNPSSVRAELKLTDWAIYVSQNDAQNAGDFAKEEVMASTREQT